MNIFKKIFSKKENKKPKNKNSKIKRLALNKIEKLKNKRFSDETFNELIFVFRVFIEKTLSIKKHLTHEELVKELENKKIKKPIKQSIMEFSGSINKLEFSGKKMDRQEFKNLISEFTKIINST